MKAGQSILVRMEIVGGPYTTPGGQPLYTVRFPWMPENPIAIGVDDMVSDSVLCNCGYSRGRNRLTTDAD